MYKAIEKATGEIVAIKHIDLESSEEDIQEIQGEISVLSTCSSPHVTQYKTSFLRGSKLWIVMEYLGGGSCQDLLKPGPFNEYHVAIICRELLQGLDYLHREGKIHRDIKAANVLLGTSGKVKLADFGVAAQLSNIKSIRMTFVGTPFWMAPEVIQESGYDFKADIWSLGITAMEMINGAPPNADVHPMKVLFKIPKDPAPRLQGDYYSKEMKDFVASCLIKDPDNRPSAKDMLRHPFIRRAGKVEGLQELVIRKQEWEAAKGRASEPKFYEETLKAMPSPEAEEQDGWVFDTVKAVPTIASKPQYATAQRRQVSFSRSSTLVEEEDDGHGVADELMAKLSIAERGCQPPATPNFYSPNSKEKRIPSTMRHVSSISSPSKRRASSQNVNNASPSKRKTSLIGTAQRKPLAADTSFGNAGSSVRQFRRVSGDYVSPPISRATSGAYSMQDDILEESDAQTGYETSRRKPASMTPTSTVITRDALLGHRAFTKCIDPAAQEVYAQTGDSRRREAIGNAANALADLDVADPEGTWDLLVGVYSKIMRDPKLASVMAAQAGIPMAMPSSQPPTRQGSVAAYPSGKENPSPAKNRDRSETKGQRLVLSNNNPHLKSHKRRQSSFMPATQDPLGVGSGLGRKGALDDLPGESIPGLEHTKQLADDLYSGWIKGLVQRWPQVG